MNVNSLPGHPKWRRSDIERFAEGLFKPSGRSFFGATRRLHDEHVVERARRGTK